MTSRAVLLACFLSVLVSVGQTDELTDNVDAFVENMLKCRDIVGLNLAVVRGGSGSAAGNGGAETVMTRGYGVIDLEDMEPVSETTLIGIASLTKAFTATLLGQVLKDNGHTWDTRLRDLLGDDFYFWDGLRTSQATVRDLAAHRLGIPRNNYARMQAPTREEVTRLVRFYEPTEELRGSFVYNNIFYGLMTYLTEDLAGISWEDALREKIFTPLGMSKSTFTHEVDFSRDDIAKPYLRDNGTWRPVALEFHSAWGELGGSGAILSSAVDMANWLHLQLNNGTNNAGVPVVDVDVLKETHARSSFLPVYKNLEPFRQPNIPVTMDQNAYGLGWRLGTYRGWRLSVHTGTSWGYGGLITILHEPGLAIFTGITGPDGGYLGRYLIHLYILDLLLGETPWLNLDNACSIGTSSTNHSPQPQPEMNPQPSRPLSYYTGTYGNFGYGNITFFTEDDSVLRLRYGDLGFWDLSVTDEADEFSGKGTGISWMTNLKSIRFTGGEGGRASGARAESVTVSFDTMLPPVFHRGLQMSEAPPPPDPDECGSKTTSATSLTLARTIITCIITILAAVTIM